MQVLRLLPRCRKAYRALRVMEARENWSRSDVDAFQLERLNALWQHAARHVPYYRDLRAQRGLPSRFVDLPEFRAAMPLLPQSAVRAQPSHFLSDSPERGRWRRSGGSTGTPMSVYWGRSALHEHLGAKYRMQAMWDLDIVDRKAFLWGHAGSFAPGLAGHLARWHQPWEDRLHNRLRLSAYRMGSEDLGAYLQRIASFRPRSLYGYSTALYLLARKAAAMAYRCPSLKLAILAGEPALPHLVARIQRAFDVPTAVEYGAIECGFIAGQGPDGRLRVREDICLVETLPRDDGLFDIVVTVLGNPSFPLIRYVIQDLSSAPLVVPAAGFAVLSEVLGRSNDLLVSRSGRLVHSLVVMSLLKQCPGVRRFRAHQLASGDLVVTVETANPAMPPATTEAERQLRQLLEGYAVRVEAVEAIAHTLAGKHRWIVSDLAEQHRQLTDASA